MPDDYKPTIGISLIVGVLISAYLSENATEIYKSPLQLCEYHIKVVDTVNTRITHDKFGTALGHYDTTIVSGYISRDTIKSNCKDIE
jgi:hypothetical protein